MNSIARESLAPISYVAYFSRVACGGCNIHESRMTQPCIFFLLVRIVSFRRFDSVRKQQYSTIRVSKRNVQFVVQYVTYYKTSVIVQYE